MKVFGRTDIGRTRSSNQDTYRSGVISDTCLWTLVCDGMGGVNGGNIASAVAADRIAEILAEELKAQMSEEDIINLVNKAINEANSSVFSRSVDEPELKGMGTTAVLTIVSDNKFFISHVGDSRAYMYMAGQVTQITVDHSYVQDLVDRGEITPEEARIHPHRNIITRSLGVHSMVENDIYTGDFEIGSVLIACSDGLSNYLTDEKLAEILSQTEPENAVEELVNFALESGGSDNITAAVIYNS